MREVNPCPAPLAVAESLRLTPTMSYEDLMSRHGQKIRGSLWKNQKGLCAFCCNSLDQKEKTRVAHLQPQSTDPTQSTRVENFLLSCDSESMKDISCDSAQRNRDLPVSPFTPNVQALFSYQFSGEMQGLTDEARESIRILNLDSPIGDRNHRLRSARRIAIQVFLRHIIGKGDQAIADYLNGAKSLSLPAFQPALKHIFLRG